MRYIVMGQKALTEGFALLGFETFPDATTDQVESLLTGLLKRPEKALVLLESTLTYKHGAKTSEEILPALSRARREAAWVIITEIPPLHSPEVYRPSVETLLARVLGDSVLDKPA
jgi:vacuolar-type H+-ATPase subunit F/Vma7